MKGEDVSGYDECWPPGWVMPLVIISGLPCSGKTSRANELAVYIKANHPGKAVEVLSEENMGADRATEYKDSTLEKKARANFISAIARRTNKETIIIADGLNYIKGFRYQLYCVAREMSTPHCLLQTVISERECRRRNQELKRYPEAVFEELLLRYEEPSNQARWDSPLFTVGDDDDMNWESMCQVILGGTTRPPSMSTAMKPVSTGGELLALLDRTTQRMAETIIDQVRLVGVPTIVPFKKGPLMIRKPVLMGDLQRLRRQFMHMNKLHQADPENVELLFIQYLESNLK
jgi:protein KTI12